MFNGKYNKEYNIENIVEDCSKITHHPIDGHKMYGAEYTYFNSGEVGRNGVSTIIVYAYNGILSEEYIIQTISTKPGIGYDQKKR